MNLTETRQQPPNLTLASRLYWLNGLITVTVLILIGLMRKIKIDVPEGIHFDFLPPIYSAINVLAAVLLMTALLMIKRGHVTAHRRAINGAMICSLLFLLCYVVYHFTTAETRFGGTGTIKVVYLLLLISHIVLAAASLPFILLTWTFGMTNQFERHRRLARYVFPVWLYVAVSGPVCYFMLRPYY